MNGSLFQHKLLKKTLNQVKLKLTTNFKMKSGRNGSFKRTNLSKHRHFCQGCLLN